MLSSRIQRIEDTIKDNNRMIIVNHYFSISIAKNFYHVHIVVSNLSLDKINQPSISSSFINQPQISNISLSLSPIPASTCITPSLQMSTGTTINEPLSTSFRNIYANNNLQQPPTLAKCLTIRPSKKGNYMPSTAIDRSELVHPSVIINKYPAYRTPSRTPTLARKLAEHLLWCSCSEAMYHSLDTGMSQLFQSESSMI